jgi:hypothetical protein
MVTVEITVPFLIRDKHPGYTTLTLAIIIHDVFTVQKL